MRLLLFLFLGLSLSTFSQWKELETFPVKVDVLEVDELGNIYYSKGNSFQKMNSKGEMLASYSNAYLGEIFSFDVSDPFRLLLFYKEFNQVVFLDNNLIALRDPVSLDELGVYSADAVCASHRGGFWVFDGSSSELCRYNSNLILEQKSSIMAGVLSFDDMANTILESADNLMLVFENKGILLFDSFGTFIRQIRTNNCRFLNTESQKLLYLEDDKVVEYDIRTREYLYFDLPTTEIVEMAMNDGLWYFADNEKIIFFSK